MNHLYFDFETFSSEDISKAGAYRYTQSPDFEILLLAFAINDGPVILIDMEELPVFPQLFLRYLSDPNTVKHAHNAAFERLCLKAYGINVPIEQFSCSAVKALYCGLPSSLDKVSKALNLEANKDAQGKALIKYFCCPQKPTKSNNFRLRNFPAHDPQKWEAFKKYCAQDVVVEREIIAALAEYELPTFEKVNYIVDQHINDRGVEVDVNFINNAISLDQITSQLISYELKMLTNLENPNSGAQFKKWFNDATGENIQSLAKESFQKLFTLTEDPAILHALKLYEAGSKTSIAKYAAALDSVALNSRIRGLIQFYGAGRTGRYAGRLVQVQNLPRNYMKDLDEARKLVANGDFETFDLVYDNSKKVLSELIRTMFVPKDGTIFGVMDFSAIEARVISWLAKEQWRLEVFKLHGKIYEANASNMFNIPIEDVDKEQRFKGKVAELALGFQGGPNALERMEKAAGAVVELTPAERKSIVTKWRKANPKIVALWDDYQEQAINAITYPGKIFYDCNRIIAFHYDRLYLTLELPSGRKLFYYKPKLVPGKYGGLSVTYYGLTDNSVWSIQDIYGGIFVQNVTQAIARDLLATALQDLHSENFEVCMHIHDEVVAELPIETAVHDLERISEIMSKAPEWAKDLPIKSSGFLTPYYKKD